MKNRKSGLTAVVTLFLITAVMAGLLALVNSVTAGPIAAAQREKTERALSGVLREGVELGEQLESFPDETGLVEGVYKTSDGYVVEVTPSGFGGLIDMMVGVDSEGVCTGISIIDMSETAGLGANASKDEFRAQFVGKSGTVSVTKDGGDIDALTGATITSRAVSNGVTSALEAVAELG